MPTPTYDAIVVGSGITGGWAAKELTEKGLNTLILEAGRPITPTGLRAHGHRRFVRMTTPERITSLRHSSGIWSLVHAERAALAADLADLTDQQ